MANNEFLTEGIVPEDLSGYEAVLTTEAVYEPGECTFKCLGIQLGGKGKGKPMTFGFEITDGPGDKHTNKGRQLRKTLNLEEDFCKKVIRGICERLGGADGLVKGQPNIGAVAGVEFKARLFAKSYEDKHGQNKTGYEIDLQSIKVTKKGKAAQTAAANAANEPQG